MMREIPLTQNKVAIIDDEDYERVMAYKWYAARASGLWYAQRCIRYPDKPMIIIKMHRFIIGEETCAGKYVDHRDHNGLNNCKSNIRAATPLQNGRNKRKPQNNTSGYKGVSWDKEYGKWVAHITTGTPARKKKLGRHATAEAAARAYDAAAILLYGEFAHLNFPLTSI